MSEFKDNFPGILVAYLNDTCYTLDNSQCNELTKLVQRFEDDNIALRAELTQVHEMLIYANGTIQNKDVALEAYRAEIAALKGFQQNAPKEADYIVFLDGDIPELDAARARIAELEERIDVAEGTSYKRSLRIAELETALKELALAAANDMRHADDASDAGWETLKELSDALAKANRLTQPLPAAQEVSK